MPEKKLMTDFKKLLQSDQFAFLTITCLMTGFLFSKTVSNVGFLFAGLYVIANFQNAKKWLVNPWFVTCGLIPIWVILVDVYCNGWDFLKGRGLMKAVLYLLPVFVLTFQPDQKWKLRVHWLILATMMCSSFYSLWLYFRSWDDVNLMYKTAKVISTLSYKDHIRIGWMTVVSMLLAGYSFTESENKKTRIVLGMYIVFQFIFLHILGSKMGLISLYLSIFIIMAGSAIRYNPKWILLFPVFLILPYLAYKSIPSLTERVNYTIWDFSHYIRGEYKTGLSDATRVNSIKAGIEIIKENPWTGTGFIRLHEETNEWYKQNLPELPEKDRFIPISQVIIFWASGGIIGLLTILSHILMPFLFKDHRKSILFLAFYVPLALSLFVETHLENQLPLSMYGLMIGWFYYLVKGPGVNKTL